MIVEFTPLMHRCTPLMDEYISLKAESIPQNGTYNKLPLIKVIVKCTTLIFKCTLLMHKCTPLIDEYISLRLNVFHRRRCTISSHS